MAIRYAKNEPEVPEQPAKHAPVKNIEAVKNAVLDTTKRMTQDKPKAKVSSTARTKKWRDEHREECRAYNRDYQRKRRTKE
jgi:hypothetical protein